MNSLFKLTHVMLMMHIHEVPLGSRETHNLNDKGQYCLKILVVFAGNGVIVHCSCHHGSLTNQKVLEMSSFGQKLLHSSNPLNIPLRLRFRHAEKYATPTCLANGDWAAGFPFVLVSPDNNNNNSNQFTACQLAMKEHWKSFTDLNQYLVRRYPLVRKEQTLCDMVYMAVNVWNYRQTMDGDPCHVHSVVCAHNLELYFDEGRVVRQGPVLDMVSNRDAIMQNLGLMPIMNNIRPQFQEPGDGEGVIAEDELME